MWSGLSMAKKGKKHLYYGLSTYRKNGLGILVGPPHSSQPGHDDAVRCPLLDGCGAGETCDISCRAGGLRLINVGPGILLISTLTT